MGLFVRSEWVAAPAVGSLPGTAPYFLRCFESVRQIVSYRELYLLVQWNRFQMRHMTFLMASEARK